MFRVLCVPSSGSIDRASLKLLVMFCVRRRCLAAWYLDLWCVCVCVRAWCDALRTTVVHSSSHQAHTPQVQISRCQTRTTHTKHHK